MKYKYGDRVRINLPFYEKANGVVIGYDEHADSQYFVQITSVAGRIDKPDYANFKETELVSMEGNRL